MASKAKEPEKRNRHAVKAPKRDYFMLDPRKLTVITDPKHPRYDPIRSKFPIRDGLVKNILKMGVLKPIIAYKRGEECIVLDGNQRTIHACAAIEIQLEHGASEGDLLLIPVIFRTVKDDSQAAFIRISANISRPPTVMENAATALHMVETLGRSVEETADVHGVTPSAVKTWLKAMTLTPQARAAIDDGRLPLKEAVGELVALPEPEQLKRLATMVERRTPADGGAGERKKSGAPTKTKSGRPPMALLKRIAATKLEVIGLERAFLLGIQYAAGAVTAEALLEENAGLAQLLAPPSKAEETDVEATEAA